MTFVPNSVLTAAQLNTFIRDNVTETMAGTATTAGRYFVTTATNTIAEAIPTFDYIVAQETSTSTDWVDLTTIGPTVSVTTQTRALVMLSCGMQIATSGAAWMGYRISGATSVDERNNMALMTQRNVLVRNGAFFLEENLTPGINTFSARYRTTGGNTGTWVNRRLSIMPF
jgi:hypothetical protein